METREKRNPLAKENGHMWMCGYECGDSLGGYNKECDCDAAWWSKNRNPQNIEDHQTGVCPYGQADGLDDYCKDCECDDGWFDDEKY